MSGESFLNGRVVLHAGDCLDVLRALPSNSIDACVTDPPYALVSIARRFGKDGAAPSKVPEGGSGAYARASAGFMGKAWDTGERAFAVEFWAEVYRVLKPGGHVLAFSATRTVHRLTCAIEDAGFEIRDMLAWLYGSGFPKSHDVAKGIDKAAGAEREVIGQRRNNKGDSGTQTYAALGAFAQSKFSDVTAPATDGARQWEGWGSALKPALEPICLARKPLDGTIAENVLAHGTGALNIAACRVATLDELRAGAGVLWSHQRKGEASAERRYTTEGSTNFAATPGPRGGSPDGRWPANVLHDGSSEVVAAFPEAPGQQRALKGGEDSKAEIYGKFGPKLAHEPRGDSGSAARFFYSAKADSDDRIGSKHPTVKPVDLMRWLVRLVTPPGGTVLDPFAGTGTTGEAAFREGFSAVLVEREAEYRADIARRMELVLAGPDGRKHAIAKAKAKPDDMAGTLFAIPAPMAAE